MNTTQPAAPSAATLSALEDRRRSTLRSEAVEQVMRACDDDLALLPFLDVEPGSRAAASALGRLLCEVPQRLVAGCPLIALVTDGVADLHWREVCPPREGSMFATLEFLTALYGPAGEDDPYTALGVLRQRSDAELGATL